MARRKELNMLRKTLANELGDVTAQQIRKYEFGINQITAARLYQISLVLKVPIDYFYKGIDTVQPATESTDYAYQFITTRHGLDIAKCFMELKSDKTRQIIRDLVCDAAEKMK